MRKKRPFLLLEALLATAIIGLCSGIILGTPMQLYKKHLEKLQDLELSRQADHLFLHVQKHLPAKHPWDTLTSQEDSFFPLTPFEINISPHLLTTYQCAYQLKIKKDKEGQNNTHHKLLECTIYFIKNSSPIDWNPTSHRKGHHFTYKLVASATPKRAFT